MIRAAALLAVLLPLLAACQTDTARERLAFAQAACGGCHAVEAYALSPDPTAPAFAAIANREGVDAINLGNWLRNAHNYPEAMEFTLEEHHIEGLVAQIMALRRADYEPVQ